MKLKYAVGAFTLTLLSQAGYSQSLVTISVPGTPGCSITGVTSLTSSGTNTFTATGGSAVNCGTTTGPQTDPPVMNANPASQSYILGSANAAPSFTWSATNAVSCKANLTGSAVFNNFAFTGAFPTSSTAAATQELCTAGAAAGSCGGVVTATPTAGAATGANNITITCKAPDNSTTSRGLTITLQQPQTVGTCDESNTGDITGFTRSCSGTVSYSYFAPTYGGELDQLSQMFGNWPGTTTLFGQAAVFTLAKTKYLSLAFTPTTSNTVKYTTNISWGAGGAISISTVQGSLLKGSPGYVCGQAFGGSNSLVVSSNNTASAQCKLTPGVPYFMNFANINSSGTAGCTKATCNMAYTLLKVN
jgi:hypothetical protein